MLRRRILAAVKNLLQEHTLLPVSFKFQKKNLVGELKGELRAEVERENSPNKVASIEKGKGTIGSKSNRSNKSNRSRQGSFKDSPRLGSSRNLSNSASPRSLKSKSPRSTSNLN